MHRGGCAPAQHAAHFCVPGLRTLCVYIYIWWQPAARGHRAYTDLSAARVWGQSYMHSLQPCQLGNDSLLNMVPIPPLGNAWRGLPW